MPTYRVPGVYFEWLDAARSIQGARTDIAGFVGVASRGPLHTPVQIESWTQFTTTFGGHIASGYLAYAAEGFFTNGGARCWVVRVADPATAAAGTVDLLAPSGAPSLTLRASSVGTWSANLRVSIVRTTSERFTMLLQLPDGPQEAWRGLSMQPPSIDLLDGAGDPLLRLAVVDPSLWTSRLSVKLTWPTATTFSLALFKDGELRASWTDLVMDTTSPRFAQTLIAAQSPTLAQARDLRRPGVAGALPDAGASNLHNGTGWLVADSRFVGTVLNEPTTGSQLVRVTQIADAAGFPENLPADAIFSGLKGGADGLRTLTLNHFTGDAVRGNTPWGLAALASINEISVVAIPDAVAPPRVDVRRPPPARDCTKIVVHPADPIVPEPELRPAFDEDSVSVLQQALVRHCEVAKDRTCILDSPSREMSARQILGWRRQFDSSYAALYFPWIEMTDPLEFEGLLRAVPPCGHVAGVYARCDLGTGVHKPPANELVEGAKNLTIPVDDVDHGDLNDAAINVIRAINGRGIRINGARTLSSDTLLLFLNVRRLLIMIERSIDQSSQWTVFEPNNRDLWREIARVARAFLDRLWKRGMLDGASVEQAYSVTCDETTNPPEQTDVGLMVCEIGVQPPWPAEFVVVRIGRTEDRTEILETTGVRNG